MSRVTAIDNEEESRFEFVNPLVRFFRSTRSLILLIVYAKDVSPPLNSDKADISGINQRTREFSSLEDPLKVVLYINPLYISQFARVFESNAAITDEFSPEATTETCFIKG